jgi:hypothetical protein
MNIFPVCHLILVKVENLRILFPIGTDTASDKNVGMIHLTNNKELGRH